MISKKHKIVLQKFGTHVKFLREMKGLSLRELSYVCNLDNSKISKIEQGKVNVTILTLIDLAAGLDLPPADLLDLRKEAGSQ